MAFKPRGGFPPIVRKSDVEIKPRALETRGFAVNQIVDIREIMKETKKEASKPFIGFDTDEEQSFTLNLSDDPYLTFHPYLNRQPRSHQEMDSAIMA